jgi:hypothetical protein
MNSVRPHEKRRRDAWSEYCGVEPRNPPALEQPLVRGGTPPQAEVVSESHRGTVPACGPARQRRPVALSLSPRPNPPRPPRVTLERAGATNSPTAEGGRPAAVNMTAPNRSRLAAGVYASRRPQRRPPWRQPQELAVASRGRWPCGLRGCGRFVVGGGASRFELDRLQAQNPRLRSAAACVSDELAQSQDARRYLCRRRVSSQACGDVVVRSVPMPDPDSSPDCGRAREDSESRPRTRCRRS